VEAESADKACRLAKRDILDDGIDYYCSGMVCIIDTHHPRVYVSRVRVCDIPQSAVRVDDSGHVQ
jgi:hypothetical protein